MAVTRTGLIRVTVNVSPRERRLLDDYCEHVERSKTEIIRELIRTLEAKLHEDDASVQKSTKRKVTA